ncbi:ABC-type branched-chain amino acid transport system, periplasmic component [Thermus thermophilus]|uniref:ABC transporter substrate-binding protein n=1 Tax=Thermus thermophilus TaxID=274 RepID=UPI00090B40C5|nr:ABC transporter substrate-binding protein [Thermus thermophilus]BAW01208.1 ABC-type branched-chain amino acid transport system, periplasmic component [Thermus thermophilus]BDB11869.1 ABC transporter substrate-binding protein [Thermus thermophilus]
MFRIITWILALLVGKLYKLQLIARANMPWIPDSSRGWWCNFGVYSKALDIRRCAVRFAWALVVLLGSALAQYRIGSHLPLTGSLARIGGEMANGVRLAVEHFNQANPNLKVELVLLDDESSPAKAVAAVERLVGRERVLGITGGYGSNLIGPASEVAERARVPYITSGGLARELTERGFKYFFRFTNVQGYTVVVDLIARGFGAKRVALLHDDGAGGTDVAKAVLERIQEAGLEVVFQSSYPGRATDLRTPLERVSRSGAEVLIFIGYENNYAVALRNAQVVRPNLNAFVGLYSLITPSLLKDLGSLMEGVYGTEPWTDGSAPVALRAEEARFVRDYRDRFRERPGYLAALGYVQTKLLLEALKQAASQGTPTPQAVRDALAVQQGQTLVSEVRFDEKGDNVVYRTVVSQVQGGKGVPVWPRERAYGRFIYPKVPWR